MATFYDERGKFDGLIFLVKAGPDMGRLQRKGSCIRPFTPAKHRHALSIRADAVDVDGA